MTPSQEIAVACCTMIGGLLSLIGSTTIVYRIISQQKFKQDSYHRLLMGACVSDIVSSIGWIMYAFIPPKETSDRYLSIGNTASCTATSFFMQFAVFVYVIYNPSLAIYFLVSIRYNWKASKIKRMETIMHIVGIILGLVCAVIPLSLQLYNENTVGLGCWLNTLPIGCQSDRNVDCVRGTISPAAIGYAVAGVPAVLALVTVVVSNYLVVKTVRSKERTTLRISQLPQFNEQQAKRTKATAAQATWYVVIFFNSLFWLIAFRVLSDFDVITRENESRWTIFIAASQFFSSSAGFGFMLVFARPRYLRFRERDQMTRCGAFMAALSFDDRKRRRRFKQSSTSDTQQHGMLPSSGNHSDNKVLGDSTSSSVEICTSTHPEETNLAPTDSECKEPLA